MKYLLDANAWIGHLRQTYPTVTDLPRPVGYEEISISASAPSSSR
jgi:hypothetical protein